MKEQTLKFNQPASKQRGSAMLWALLGLVGFAALVWFCVARHVPVLEQRLQTSVMGAIEPLNVENVNVEMNGYAANISGAVQNSTVRDNVIAAAGGVAGVRTVNDNLQLIASPVTANVDNDDSNDQNLVEPAVTDVEAPTDAEEAPASPEQPQATPAENAESPEVAVAQELPAPSEEPQTSTGANEEPAELNISVADRTLTLTGRVQDQRELRPIVEVVMTTFDLNYVSNKTSAADSIGPMGWMDGLVTSLPELKSIKNPSIDVFDQQITLGGMVGSEADQQSIIASVQKNLPDLSLVNRLQVEGASDEPTDTNENATDLAVKDTTENTAPATDEASEAARQAAIEEEFRVAAQQREAQAVAKAQAAAEERAALEANAAAAAQAEEAAKAEQEAAEKAAADEAAETKAEDPVAIASQDLSTAFDALPNTQILFQSGSDVFTPVSEERLDQIAELLSQYPTVRVAIKGHTDNQGGEANNLALSQLRANAVRDYLVSKGISVFRLSSFGYGEGVPIASNDTQDGRAANRRIEFSF